MLSVLQRIWGSNQKLYNSKKASNKYVIGIGGNLKIIGNPSIQVEFQYLKLITDVDIILISEDIPSLLYMRNMTENDLNKYLQKCHVSFNGRTQKLEMSYFSSSNIVNWNKCL